MALKLPKFGSCRGNRFAKMAPKTLSPSHPTQIRKRGPRGPRLSARGSVNTSTTALLTADPRVDQVDREVEEEVDEDHEDGHHQHDVLDEQVVAGVDRRDQGVAESRDLQQVL